ncbi:MAG: glycosyltransferase family 4 protein [Halothece sp.]
MNIVMISSTFPYPPSRSGTEVRTFNFLKYLNERHSVTLATQRSPGVSDNDIEALRNVVPNMVIFPMRKGIFPKTGMRDLWGKGLRLLESAIQGKPPNVIHAYSPELQGWLDDQVRQGKCDAITCEHSINAVYIRPEFPVKTLVNVHSSVYWGTVNALKMGASENPKRDRFYLPILYRYEKNYCQQIDQIVVTTPVDEEQLRRLNPKAKIAVIPNGVDLELFPYRSHDPGGQDLVFCGAMDFSHNIDSARFFAETVFPAIQERYPKATFTIVGNRPVPEIVALGDRPGITVTGRVPSVAACLHLATVCVVPLRTGFGIKNKTLEAMAAGIPVVGSDRGLEGLAVENPLRALRANTVEEYVTTISRLFEDASLRAELSQNARSLIETEFTWEEAGHRYEELLIH